MLYQGAWLDWNRNIEWLLEVSKKYIYRTIRIDWANQFVRKMNSEVFLEKLYSHHWYIKDFASRFVVGKEISSKQASLARETKINECARIKVSKHDASLVVKTIRRRLDKNTLNDLTTQLFTLADVYHSFSNEGEINLLGEIIGFDVTIDGQSFVIVRVVLVKYEWSLAKFI